MDFKKFRTDDKLENDGAWIDIGEGLELLIGRLGSKRHSDSYKRHTSGAAVAKAIKDGTMPPEDYAKIHATVLAESILLDWKGLEEDGKPIAYSPEKARELLEVKDFRALVHDEAAKQSNFRVADIAGSVDALKKSSVGT